MKVQKSADLTLKATQLYAEISALKKELDSLNSKMAASKLDDILATAKTVKSVRLATVDMGDAAADVVRSLGDELKARYDDIVAVLATKRDGAVQLLAVAGKNAVASGAHAGKLVGAVASVTGGKGGGRPDNAMAGGKDASKLAEAFAVAETTLDGMLK